MADLRVRSIFIVAQLVYDPATWPLEQVARNLPDFVGLVLDDPAEREHAGEEARYWVKNPTVYLNRADMEADERDVVGPFTALQYRGYALEISAAPPWTVWAYLLAPLRISQYMRNDLSIPHATAASREAAIAAVQAEIDRRLAAGRLPDVVGVDYEWDEEPFVPEETHDA